MHRLTRDIQLFDIYKFHTKKNKKLLLHNNDHITDKQVLAEKFVNFIAVSFTSPV